MIEGAGSTIYYISTSSVVRSFEWNGNSYLLGSDIKEGGKERFLEMVAMNSDATILGLAGEGSRGPARMHEGIDSSFVRLGFDIDISSVSSVSMNSDGSVIALGRCLPTDPVSATS
mmetsp:Transcript_9970/g.13040  ORF Transcript_9970/g.13040 Transcript_9970/m.13040 type:complete len:116 (+) Transcript_9970:176-523(+)